MYVLVLIQGPLLCAAVSCLAIYRSLARESADLSCAGFLYSFDSTHHLAAAALPLARDDPASPVAALSTLQDYGWAGAGWHNSVLTGGQREVQTPHMDKLVATGIELNQHYTFKFCSPTRSSLQSGRNPIHVNVQNVGPDRHNPDDPVAGFSAIARNMTGMAVHMQAA